MLKKTYTNVDISFKEINDKDRQKIAKRDIRDKMTITYSGDKTIKEETGGYKYPLMMCAVTLVTAYVVCFLIYNVGLALGFG